MKRFLCVILAVVLCSLCSCTTQTTQNITQTSPDNTTKYQVITQINHCAVEPDDRLVMTDEDFKNYNALMDALLNRSKTVKLSDSKDKNEFYIDLLKQSPYCFFAKSCTLKHDTVTFEFAYTEKEQSQMLSFLDEKILEIANADITPQDNELDIILKIHSAVSKEMIYDHDRTDNKQLGSPLFNYPSDEIYKALKNKKSLCYGYAYTMRFALLQHNIDCFCVYGPCAYRDEAHMWNIFKLNDKFYTCDPAWDRSENEYPRLYHFGKTDAERFSDGLQTWEFSSKLFSEYGKIECTDETFKIFRGINRYTFTKDHTYFMVDFDGNEMLFDSETIKLR